MEAMGVLEAILQYAAILHLPVQVVEVEVLVEMVQMHCLLEQELLLVVMEAVLSLST
jgi:hypothetical protein